MSDQYRWFLEAKAPKAVERGFEPMKMPNHLFGHQATCIEHNLRCGSGGLFLDTGLGKTACELEWSRQFAEKSHGKALILTPLAAIGRASWRERVCQSV